MLQYLPLTIYLTLWSIKEEIMDIEEIEKIIGKLNSIQQAYGLGGAILIFIIVLIFIVLWKFLVKNTEMIAEEISEKNLRKFQSVLDKDMIRYSSKHQKQIDAVQDCYQNFQELLQFIKLVANGDKFIAPLQNDEEVKYLTKYRFQFKKSFDRHKIVLPKELNFKVEQILPEIDQFITDYIGGLLPSIPQESDSKAEGTGVQIAGIWAVGELEVTLSKMEEISGQIEIEFRKIYGTDEK